MEHFPARVPPTLIVRGENEFPALLILLPKVGFSKLGAVGNHLRLYESLALQGLQGWSVYVSTAEAWCEVPRGTWARVSTVWDGLHSGSPLLAQACVQMVTCEQHLQLCFQFFFFLNLFILLWDVFSFSAPSFNLFKDKKQESGGWLLAWDSIWFLDLKWPFENERENQSHYLRVFISLAKGKMASHYSWGMSILWSIL